MRLVVFDGLCVLNEKCPAHCRKANLIIYTCRSIFFWSNDFVSLLFVARMESREW